MAIDFVCTIFRKQCLFVAIVCGVLWWTLFALLFGHCHLLYIQTCKSLTKTDTLPFTLLSHSFTHSILQPDTDKYANLRKEKIIILP